MNEYFSVYTKMGSTRKESDRWKKYQKSKKLAEFSYRKERFCKYLSKFVFCLLNRQKAIVIRW